MEDSTRYINSYTVEFFAFDMLVSKQFNSEEEAMEFIQECLGGDCWNFYPTV